MRKSLLLRALLTAVGLLFLALTLLNPRTETSFEDIHEGRKATAMLIPGETWVIPLGGSGEISEVSVVLSNVKEAKALTLHMALLKDGEAVASQSVSLEKAKGRGRVKLTPEAAVPAGSYDLALSVEGTGQVSFLGDGEAVGVRITQARTTYVAASGFSGVMLLLLALTPSGTGGKERNVHASV